MNGAGSVYPERGQWIAQLSIGPRGYRQKIRRTRSTRREALVALAELRVAARPARLNRTTTGAYLEQWVRDVRNLRPETMRGYEIAVRYHLVPTIGHIRLADLGPLDVEHMLAVVGQRVSPKTLRNTHSVLRRALTMAVRAGLVTRNVAAREFVDPPRAPVEEPKALSVDEVHRLLAEARGDPIEPLLIVAVGTGLRTGELLGLAWEDIDLEAGRLSVRRELARVGNTYQRVEPKTPGSRRAVPLSASTMAALRLQRDRTIAAGFVPTATGPVFTNRQGGPLNGSWVNRHTQALELRAGIRPLPFRKLRSTYASRLAEAGIADLEIARLLGHTRTHVTKKHYIAAGPTPLAALEAVEVLIGNGSPTGHGGIGRTHAE